MDFYCSFRWIFVSGKISKEVETEFSEDEEELIIRMYNLLGERFFQPF